MEDLDQPDELSKVGKWPARQRFGAQLRRLREATGLTQQALANRIGVSAAMLSHLEAGRRSASADMLTKLETALGLDPVQLITLRHMAQVSTMPDDLVQWIVRPDISFPTLAAFVDFNEDAPSQKSDTSRSVDEAGLERLLETQLQNARNGRFGSGDRITKLAAVVDELQDLDSDDLLRVSGFLAGLRASKSKPAGDQPG